MKTAKKNSAIALVMRGFSFEFDAERSEFTWDTLGTLQVFKSHIFITYGSEVFSENIDASPKMILESINRVRAQFYE